MDQNEFEMRYVILTQNILQEKQLTSNEKLVLAHITGFDQFFESPKTTADFLNLTELIVQRAKRKLLALGYIEQIGDTGRGKIYRANLWKTSRRCDQKVISDVTQKSHQMLLESATYNKDKNKDKVFIGKTNKKEPVENSYGRADINALVEMWESEVGISLKGNTNSRRQLYNLLRKHGAEKIKQIIRLAGKAAKSNDRFAPRIATPADLTGKFEKLSRLELWESRNQIARPFGNHQTPAPSVALAPLSEKLPDYEGAFDEQSDEEREKVAEMMREARKKLLK